MGVANAQPFGHALLLICFLCCAAVSFISGSASDTDGQQSKRDNLIIGYSTLAISQLHIGISQSQQASRTGIISV